MYYSFWRELQLKNALDEYADGSGSNIQFNRQKYAPTYIMAMKQLEALKNGEDRMSVRFAAYRAELVQRAKYVTFSLKTDSINFYV